jgi:very-short-patch-repair endonuclease
MPRHFVPTRNRALAKQMRRRMPDAEFRLWCELRNRNLGGLAFRRQHPIGRYIVDFFCPQAKLIVEVDGGQHALAPQLAADGDRTRWLEAQGYTVIRFWTDDVTKDLDGVCTAILAAGARRMAEPASGIWLTPTY